MFFMSLPPFFKEYEKRFLKKLDLKHYQNIIKKSSNHLITTLTNEHEDETTLQFA